MITIGGNNIIFTTGAFLEPIKIDNGYGKEKWIWQVLEFIDESFMDGDIYNPPESADSLENLMINLTPDPDS
jgi:hypothetical protein